MSAPIGYRGPSVDHSLLSPSGKVSRRAREAAIRREAQRLFPPGTFYEPPPETNAQQRDRLLASAAQLRELAARGMGRRKHVREAERLERQARELVP